MARRRVKGGGMVDRHGEDERGMGPVGRLRENGPNGHSTDDEKKENKFKF
jgi:hypothetical protein